MIPFNFNLVIDFEKDWRDFIKKQLNLLFFLKEEDINNLTEENIAHVYFELKNRLIPEGQRNVHFSKEFSCHSSIRLGLDNLVDNIQLGKDLTPHLSRQIKNLNTVDGLLNDWGIHHLHLGIEIETDGFAKRRGELLYVFFNDTDAYLIQIMDHHSFSKKELLRILHKNWPSLIDRYLLKGITSFSPNPTDNEIRELRDAGITALIQIEEGAVYAPAGGGINSAGTSTRAIMVSDRYYNQINLYEQHIKENFYLYLRKIKEAIGEIPSNIMFKLLIEPNGMVFAYETNSRIHFKLSN